MQATDQTRFKWTDLQELGLEGKGWVETGAPYDRLPPRAEGQVRAPVWRLSRHAAGLQVRFVTDSDRIAVRWTLTDAWLSLPNMAATGVSGVDLYVRPGDGPWRWLAVGQPTAQTNSTVLVEGLPPGKREYLLYLPLHNGVQSAAIGISPDASMTCAGPWGWGPRKPVVFYGTSITQGLCASRPGMTHSAILGRRFNWPVINLGFSGQGKMELELAELLAELDPAAYVLDCLPNMTADEVAVRVEPFVQVLRKSHPTTPIVLVEDRTMQDAFLLEGRRSHHEACRRELKAAYKRLLAQGVDHLYYIEGEPLLGDDGEGTTDGSHPNDLGSVRLADVFAATLAPILEAR